MLFRSFHPADSGGQIGTQQPCICRFVCQAPNRREPKVDGRCSVALLFQIDAIAVLLKASRGSEQYQSMKSGMAWSYARCELGDVRLLRTADLDCSRSGSRRTVLGLRLRFDLGMPAFSAWHAFARYPNRKRVYRYESLARIAPLAAGNIVIDAIIM